MSIPKAKSLRVPVNGYGITLEVDTVKQQCQIPPHWHMCKMGKPIAQINVDGVWAMPPYGIGIGSIVIRKAEQLTQEYREKIIEAYKHNALYGSDSYDKI